MLMIPFVYRLAQKVGSKFLNFAPSAPEPEIELILPKRKPVEFELESIRILPSSSNALTSEEVIQLKTSKGGIYSIPASRILRIPDGADQGNYIKWMRSPEPQTAVITPKSIPDGDPMYRIEVHGWPDAIQKLRLGIGMKKEG